MVLIVLLSINCPVSLYICTCLVELLTAASRVRSVVRILEICHSKSTSLVVSCDLISLSHDPGIFGSDSVRVVTSAHRVTG